MFLFSATDACYEVTLRSESQEGSTICTQHGRTHARTHTHTYNLKCVLLAYSCIEMTNSKY